MVIHVKKETPSRVYRTSTIHDNSRSIHGNSRLIPPSPADTAHRVPTVYRTATIHDNSCSFTVIHVKKNHRLLRTRHAVSLQRERTPEGSLQTKFTIIHGQFTEIHVKNNVAAVKNGSRNALIHSIPRYHVLPKSLQTQYIPLMKIFFGKQ